MIHLYKDPKGKSLGISHSQSGSLKMAGTGVAMKGNSMTIIDLEKKVESLEKAKQDGEKTITELKQRIITLSKDINIEQVCI